MEDSGKDKQEMTREEWFDKFETMSVDEVGALFAAFSDYFLSDAFKRRCGIAPSDTVSHQAAETHDALKACLLPPGEKVKGASKDEK